MANGKMTRIVTKALAGFLSAVMVAAVIPGVLGGSKVLADETKDQDNTCLGVSGITSPDKPEGPDSEWSGSYVYFGKYKYWPIRFRVLAKDSTAQTTDKALFLDSDETLFCEWFDIESQTWSDCELRQILNGDFYDSSFTEIEKSAIPTSYMKGGEPYASGSWEEWVYVKNTGINDKIFLLDVGDVLNEDYGYSSDPGYHLTSGSWDDYNYKESNVTNHLKSGSSYFWWLRTPFGYPDVIADNVAAIYYGGQLKDISSEREIGIAPALCVDQESIIFSTLISNDDDEADKEFKLTLKDSNMEIGIQEDRYITAEDDVISVPYIITGENAEEATRASVLILDSEYTAGNTNNAKILYYDALGGEYGTDGTGTFELPSSLDMDGWGTSYHVYILAEQINDSRESDYACEPVEIDAPMNGWVEIDGEYYFFEVATCTWRTGWLKDGGNWYYLDGNGRMVKGWKKIGSDWYYFGKSGAMVTGWQKIEGTWYYFETSGKMQTGWKLIGTDWYYFGDNGKMRTEWQKIGDIWYYFGSDGRMKTGWQKISGYWYYFDSNGAMKTGWLELGDNWYYLETSGRMVTGWKEIDGTWYCFKPDGVMASDEYWDGYRLEKSGAWIYKERASWRQDAKGWWYGDDAGWYAKDQTLKIDGKLYDFDAQGYWIEK